MSSVKLQGQMSSNGIWNIIWTSNSKTAKILKTGNQYGLHDHISKKFKRKLILSYEAYRTQSVYEEFLGQAILNLWNIFCTLNTRSFKFQNKKKQPPTRNQQPRWPSWLYLIKNLFMTLRKCSSQLSLDTLLQHHRDKHFQISNFLLLGTSI